MAEPKGFQEIPGSAVPDSKLEMANPVQPSSGRDPALEALLRSKSSDDDENGAPISSKASKKKRPSRTKKAPAKTGTSLDKKPWKSRLPLVAAIVAAVVLLAGGGTALWLTLSPGAAQIDPDANSGRTQQIDGSTPGGTGADEQPNPEDEVDAPWNTEEGKFPIALAQWQQEPGTAGLTGESKAQLLETFSGSGLNIAAGRLPSELAGFTSDETKIYNEDGSANALYSYWTQESFTFEAGKIIESFLNPRFGAWESYQGRGADPNSIDPAVLFPNTFTDAALESGEPVSSWLPIYADWGNNSYGRSDLSATGPRWYGEIEDSSTTFTLDSETGQYIVNFEADVTFTAYATSGEKVSEKGKLTLEFVANPGTELGAGGKVLVNGSKLTIGG